MSDLVGTVTPRRPPGTNVVRMWVRPIDEGGDDGNDGLDVSRPLATFVEFHNRVRAHPWNTMYIADVTGIDEEPGFDLGLDLPLAADEFRFNLSPPDHRSHLAEATYTVRAVPDLVHTFAFPTVLIDPVHSMVSITESPDPGWTVNEHRRRILAGQGFFECGAIVANTSDTLLVAYAGALTPPLEILGMGARLRFGTAAAGFEFNPGLIINDRCRSVWQWIDFAIPDGNVATSLMILGGSGKTGLANCAIDGIDMRHAANVDVDGCYIERGWAFNSVSHGTQIRRSALVDANAASHDGSYFMINNRFQGCGPMGTGGTGAYAGTTSIEDCEHLNGTGNGYEVQGQGRHTLRRTFIGGATGNGAEVIGPVRVVLDDVQGNGNAGHGLRLLHGAQVESRNGTAIGGLAGDIDAGSLGDMLWVDVPFSDLSGPDPHLVRVHTPTIIPDPGGGGGGGGAWQLIETIAVGSDQGTVTFAGLDGDADGEYLIRGRWLLPNNNAGRRLIVKPNGITADQVTVWMFGGTGTPGSDSLARLVICAQEGTGRDIAKFEATLEAASGAGNRSCLWGGGAGAAALLAPPNFRAHRGFGTWNNSATGITSLVLEVVASGGASPDPSSIGAGSEISLYRIQK